MSQIQERQVYNGRENCIKKKSPENKILRESAAALRRDPEQPSLSSEVGEHVGWGPHRH